MPKKNPKPPKFVEKLQNVEVNVGKTVIIDCVCEGEPEPDCDWYFEGKLIKDEGRYRYLFEKDDIIGLEIRKVQADDEGEYKVVAFNKSGEVESKCEVLVNDPNKKKKAEKEKESTKPSSGSSFQQQSAGRVFTPGSRKKKKKLPIDREGIIADNPEKFYTFGDEIGRGKFAVVKKVTNKTDGSVWAAKIIKFDADSLKFAIREYDNMTSGRMNNRGLVQLHEAYLVRKYLILIMDLIDGDTLLATMSKKHSVTEDDVANIIKQLCQILLDLKDNNIVHLDIRPTNIRFVGREIKLLDYNSCRHLANKKAGEVVDVIGDTEFCAPELLVFDPVAPGSDMWSVGVIMYILLSGISPYYYDDEDKVVEMVGRCKYQFDPEAFENISSKAQDFIKKIFIRIPGMRLAVGDALKHEWLSAEYTSKRKRSVIKQTELDEMAETDARLYSEEEEDYVEASLVFRTFDEEEYESPVESSEEEEDE